jgi:hypothetical protein
MTKGIFDAMLAGRVAHDYGSFIFHDFTNAGIDDHSKDVASLEFINFVIFVLWAPSYWLTDLDHLRLSLADGFSKELFMRSYNYFTQNISKDDLEFYYMTDNRAYRLGDPLYFTSGHKPHEYAAYYCTGGLYSSQGDHTWSNGEYTSFEFDLTEPATEPLTVSVALHAISVDPNSPSPVQTVACTVNGVDCGTVTLAPGKKYYRFTVPADCFTDKLQVLFRYGYLHPSGDARIGVAFERMYISMPGQRLIEDAMSHEITEFEHKTSVLEANNTALTIRVAEQEAQNAGMAANIVELEAGNTELEIQVSRLDAEKSALQDQNIGLKTYLSATQMQMQAIYDSRSWKFANRIMKIAAKIVPQKNKP